MRFQAAKLKTLFDLLLHDFSFPPILELSTTDEYLIIASNYNNSYYISYVSNISNNMNQDIK